MECTTRFVNGFTYLYDFLCHVELALAEEVLTYDHVELLGMLPGEHTLHTHTRDVNLKVLPNKSRLSASPILYRQTLEIGTAEKCAH